MFSSARSSGRSSTLPGRRLDSSDFGFITGRAWDPVKHVFGALPFIYGTAVSSLVALVIATPLAIAIGLYLSEFAPRGVRGIVGSLVELLAAIPSVVLGLWGILVLGPFLADHVEPSLHGTLGFIPLFGAPQQTGQGLFTAAVILTIMIVPIVAASAVSSSWRARRARGRRAGARRDAVGDGARRDPACDAARESPRR